jgi:hypothetical protein
LVVSECCVPEWADYWPCAGSFHSSLPEKAIAANAEFHFLRQRPIHSGTDQSDVVHGLWKENTGGLDMTLKLCSNPKVESLNGRSKMTLVSHIDQLKQKHVELENRLEEAMRHPSTSDDEIIELKRQKLMLKDKISQFSA